MQQWFLLHVFCLEKSKLYKKTLIIDSCSLYNRNWGQDAIPIVYTMVIDAMMKFSSCSWLYFHENHKYVTMLGVKIRSYVGCVVSKSQTTM